MRAVSPLPELQLLFSASRRVMTAADQRAAMTVIDRGVHWDRVVEFAEFHGCLPLLHEHIASGVIAGDSIPESTRERIEVRANAIARSNLRLTAELTAIVRDLEAAGVAVLPLKGPVLAQTIYGSVALRPMRDLDVLCRRDQMDAALGRLRALGYDRIVPHDRDPLQEFDRTHHVRLRSRWSGTSVELHFQLFSWWAAPVIDLSSVESRLRRTSCLGADMSELCAEDLLVYLCLHGAGHAWERLEWICGVAELLRSGRIADWRRVSDWAAQVGGVRPLALGTSLAHELLNASAHNESAPPDRNARAAARRIQQRLMRAPIARARSIDLLHVALRMESSSAARLRRLWSVCATPQPADFDVLRLPKSLWSAYFVVRPVRLALRSVRFAFGRLAELRRRLARVVTGTTA